MSSNIQVKRICQYCNSEFMAKTTVTMYCSLQCNRRSYKARIKAEKIAKSNSETKHAKSEPEPLSTREFLSVTQAAKLIGCSRQNLYKIINSGKLKATNILQKKTIIKRSDIDVMFNQLTKDVKFNEDDCYTISGVLEKYNVSEKALYEIINRGSISKWQKGRFVFVLKSDIDSILG